jgi:hypothetical protein
VVNVVRSPLVGGLAPNVGASAVAAALHAVDVGHEAASADILVCLGIGPSLTAAEQLWPAPPGAQPILAVVHPGAGPVASLERLAALRDRYAEVVLLPYVPRWRISGTGDEATHLLAHAPEELPSDLREYAGALHVLVAALLHSGLVSRAAAPPLVRRRPPNRLAREPGAARMVARLSHAS